jgi:hypothetical protein
VALALRPRALGRHLGAARRRIGLSRQDLRDRLDHLLGRRALFQIAEGADRHRAAREMLGRMHADDHDAGLGPQPAEIADDVEAAGARK